LVAAVSLPGRFVVAGTAFCQVAKALFSCLAPACRFWRTEIHCGTPGLGPSDRHRLLQRSCSVLAFAHVMKLLAHKFSGLSCWRFPWFFIALRSFPCFLPRHVCSFLMRARRLAKRT
jgi:hypothetical protein